MSKPNRQPLLATLAERFGRNAGRHPEVAWNKVLAALEANAAALDALAAMESSGGEPDVIGTAAGRLLFCDCSPESPAGRRSLCYDRDALDARKEHKPKGSAVEAAAAIGVELLGEEDYRGLQELGEFDRKTSSWIRTPAGVRTLGGALFCDRRFGRVFTYHNGAESYYAARGWRGLLRV
ncbi:MAG: DUF4256 domain-containing protein [Candidatus Eisenbacteria bacterium]|nr:DUF4256 domain-containing protein [Candidatus Eisenbacteria bacterium]